MILKTVTRTYSRSINTKNYGVPESWIKIEATYTAECESGDDPLHISKMVYDQAKTDVLNSINEITDAIAALRAPAPTGAPSNPVTPQDAALRQPFVATQQPFNAAPRQM